MATTRTGSTGWTRLTRVMIAALAVMALAACGDDTAETERGEIPNPMGTDFAPDAIGQIPMPAGAEPVGEATEQDQTTAQSFKMPGSTPQEILTQFAAILPEDGWEVAMAPEPYGTQGYRGSWIKDSVVLEVSAGEFSPAAGDQVVSQFSLVIREGGE